MAAPLVTICVPVHNGARFVGETLASVVRQTAFREIEVVISDDASSDGSADICRALADEHGFTLVVQPERRGWIGNCNFLLERARGEFVAILPQDDVLDERYVEVLAGHLAATPACAAAYTDMRGFGRRSKTVAQPSVTGSPFERVYAVIEREFDGVAFRGLVRRTALDRAGGLPDLEFAADLNWIARLAREGELHRVPALLYFKRYHAKSTSHLWGRWDDETRLAAWAEHCADLLGVALDLALSPAEFWLATHAAVRRLIMANEQPGPQPEIRHLPVVRKAALTEALLVRFGARYFADGATEEERRRLATLVVEALNAERVAATVRTLEAGEREFVAASRTVLNLIRFFRKEPLKRHSP